MDLPITYRMNEFRSIPGGVIVDREGFTVFNASACANSVAAVMMEQNLGEICTAVNAHADLVESLAELMPLCIADLRNAEKNGFDHVAQGLRAKLDKATNALQKAKVHS